MTTTNVDQILTDSISYVREMTTADCDKLLLALSRTAGLTYSEAQAASRPEGPEWLVRLSAKHS